MHPIQSIEWEEFKRKSGVEVGRVGKFLITWHKVSGIPYKVGYLGKSEMPTPLELEEIEKEARNKKAISVRIEPDVFKNSKSKILSSKNLVRGKRVFLSKTYWFDLKKSEEELLAAMHPKARYNIRLAERKGVIVKEDNSKQAFEKYLQLTEETTKRQGFYAHNEKYHRDQWGILQPAGISHLFTATYQGEIIVTWIVFKYKDRAYYMYGASSEEHKEVMASSLLMWETLQWAKAQGCRIYDLGGMEEGKGFSEFKKRFGPEEVEFVGTYDLVINPLLYWLFRLVEGLRWWILGSLRRMRNI